VRIAKYRALLDAQKAGRVRTIGVSNLCVHCLSDCAVKTERMQRSQAPGGDPRSRARDASLESDRGARAPLPFLASSAYSVSSLLLPFIPSMTITSSFRPRVASFLACDSVFLFPPVSFPPRIPTRLSLNYIHLHRALRYMLMLGKSVSMLTQHAAPPFQPAAAYRRILPAARHRGRGLLSARPRQDGRACARRDREKSESCFSLRLTPQKTNPRCSTTASLRRCSSAGRSKRGTCPSPCAMRCLTRLYVQLCPAPEVRDACAHPLERGRIRLRARAGGYGRARCARSGQGRQLLVEPGRRRLDSQTF
jgi:hypothetical protein